MADWLCSDWNVMSHSNFKLNSCNRPWYRDTYFGFSLA